MDYSLKTISIGASDGDLYFEGLRGRFDLLDKLGTGKLHSAGSWPMAGQAVPSKRAIHSAIGSEA